ncbi:hypothetical protein MD484_g4821, partial [Candolleomyces efflorescens]
MYKLFTIAALLCVVASQAAASPSPIRFQAPPSSSTPTVKTVSNAAGDSLFRDA